MGKLNRLLVNDTNAMHRKVRGIVNNPAIAHNGLMHNLLLLLASFSAIASVSHAAPQSADIVAELKSVSGHPMQYYVVRPEGWSRDRKWPIVVALEAAEKEFKRNAERFAKAGTKLPFVVVTPITVTNGNAGHRDPAIYPYSSGTWDRIAKDGVCAFDEDGLAQVLKEGRDAHNGEELIYLTGFEAGAHLVWATVFHRPEWLAAAAPVAGNYRGRCVEGSPISKHVSRENLPIRGVSADGDKDMGPTGNDYSQWTDGKKLALSNGYRNVAEVIVAGKGHVPLPDEVLAQFSSLRKAR